MARVSAVSESDAVDVHNRTAARVLLVAPNGATLLVHGHDPEDPGRGGFYWTPGGGLDDGESLEAGARREVAEEIGFDIGELGPVVLERVGEFPFGGRQIRQTESFFLVHVDDTFDAAPEALSDLEQSAIDEFVWLTPSDMRESADLVYPRCLADLIDHVAEHGRPVTPWQTD